MGDSTDAPMAVDDTLPMADAGEPSPMRCGRYTVIGPLGAGGMGVVLSAYDPDLDRKVAIKLLRHEAPIEREAKAMAKLAHPNVVTVFEVDRVGDRTFVAMELVDGTTLRGWLQEQHRSWREIVDMFVAAGRGLVAAHAAGLVHRDFKADNVLIGRDGRPRVSDFGLVCAVDTNEPVAGAVDTSTVAGTPGYMSPEQWRGGPVDARSDQFAFCVALWEALSGNRPFAGQSPSVVRTSVLAGEIMAPSNERRVPHRVYAALRRGIAVEPAARWPDLDALLAVLARMTQRRRWVVAVIAVAAAATSASLVAAVITDSGERDPCAVPAERLARVWTPLRHGALASQLMTADPTQGGPRAAKIEAVLDEAASGWSAMYVEACRATRVEGRQSDMLLDRRMACLDQWLGELSATVAVVDRARDPVGVDQATRTALAMSPLAVCADTIALGESLPAPVDEARRAAAQSVIRTAREIEVAERSGKLDGLSARAAAMVVEARRFDYPPALAEALTAQATVAYSNGDETGGEAMVRELVQVAAKAHDDRAAVFAWGHLILTLGRERGKVDIALELVPAATAVVLHAGDPADLRADLLQREGSVLDDGPHPEQGLALLRQARAALEAGPVTPAISARIADIVFETGSAQVFVGDDAAAVASFRDAIARWRALYGDDSPDEAYGWQNLGATWQRENKDADAVEAFRTALRIRQARLGDVPMTASTMLAVATVLNRQTHWDEAVSLYDRAIAIDRSHLPAEDPQIERILINRANTLTHLNRLDEAAHGYDEVIAVYERTGAKTGDAAVAYYGRARLATRRGHCDTAVRDYARSIAIFEEAKGPRSERLVYGLVGESLCAIRGHRLADARVALDRALGLPEATTDPFQRALARAYLGWVNIASGRDVSGGRAAIVATRKVIAEDSEGHETLDEIDRWLAGSR